MNFIALIIRQSVINALFAVLLWRVLKMALSKAEIEPVLFYFIFVNEHFFFFKKIIYIFFKQPVL